LKRRKARKKKEKYIFCKYIKRTQKQLNYTNKNKTINKKTKEK